jgi:hypothetical protein
MHRNRLAADLGELVAREGSLALRWLGLERPDPIVAAFEPIAKLVRPWQQFIRDHYELFRLPAVLFGNDRVVLLEKRLAIVGAGEATWSLLCRGS